MAERLNPVNADNKRLCIALNNIRHKADRDPLSDEGVVLSWLCDGLEKMRKDNDVLAGSALQWNQGACQVVNEIIASMLIARDVLKRN